MFLKHLEQALHCLPSLCCEAHIPGSRLNKDTPSQKEELKTREVTKCNGFCMDKLRLPVEVKTQEAMRHIFFVFNPSG